MSLSHTDVVILAAGKGSRLGSMGENTPKWLLQVGSRTIAERQLDALALTRMENPEAIRSVRILTGHAAEEIERFLRTRPGDVSTLHNPDYARLNNWYSVLLAMEEVLTDPEGRLVIVNGDLFAKPEWLANFLVESTKTSHEGLIGVDLGRQLTDESMKVSVDPGPPPTVRQIGKVGVEDAAGEYVGMLMARGSVLEALHSRLRSFIDRPEHDDEWYERAVGRSAATGTPWVVHPMADSNWVEIDDDGDYSAALALTETV